jgi:hypothetical protein
VYYFPLKRAANDTQYTLGRTFLQETYMIADYERGALTLFPAVFPDSSIERQLVPITAPENIQDPTDVQVDPQSGLSRTAIIGIIVGGVVLLVLVVAGAFFWIRRNRHEKALKATSEVSGPWEKAELASSRTYYRSELDGQETCDIEHELAAPMATGNRRARLQELPGDHGGSELGPNHPIYELPGIRDTTKADLT